MFSNFFGRRRKEDSVDEGLNKKLSRGGGRGGGGRRARRNNNESGREELFGESEIDGGKGGNFFFCVGERVGSC